jgi:hypothetical protein
MNDGKHNPFLEASASHFSPIPGRYAIVAFFMAELTALIHDSFLPKCHLLNTVDYPGVRGMIALFWWRLNE